jgi:hypothetical protein
MNVEPVRPRRVPTVVADLPPLRHAAGWTKTPARRRRKVEARPRRR